MWKVFSEIPSHKKVFLKQTKPLVSMSSQPSVGGQYFLSLSEFLVSGAAALVSWHRGLRETGAIWIRRGTHFWKSCLKGEMHKEDLCSKFVSLHLSPDCKDRVPGYIYWGSWWHWREENRSIVREPSNRETAWKLLGWRSHFEKSAFFSWLSVCCRIHY